MLLYAVFTAGAIQRISVEVIGMLGRAIGAATNAARYAQLEAEMTKAAAIQTSLICPADVRKGAIRVNALYRPAAIVGGDYCDAIELPDRRMACIVADACGKGYPAALVMSNVQAALRASLHLTGNPAAAAAAVNRLLLSYQTPARFVTMVCLVVGDDGRYEIVNAGHPPPMLVGQGAFRTLDDGSNFPLGVCPDEFLTERGRMSPGQTVVLYSDGITESVDRHGNMLGVAGFRQWLADQRPCHNPAQLIDAALVHCHRFRNTKPATDDQTLLAVHLDQGSA